MEDKITCAGCGAEVDANLSKCPFCGTLIISGAEKEYMDKLHQVRSEMEELNQIPEITLKRELKHQGRRMRRVLLAAVGIAVLAAALFWWEKSKYTRDNKKDFIWGQQNFPVMSELYECEEYDKLKEIYYDALEEDKPVWNWEYYEVFSEWLEEQDEM